MGVKFCPACGTARQDADAFCRNCGRNLSEDDERGSTAAPQDAPEAATPVPPPSPPPAPAAPAAPVLTPTEVPPQAPPGYVVVPAPLTWTGPVAPPPTPSIAPAGSAATVSLPAPVPTVAPRTGIVGLKRPVRPLALVGAIVVLVAVFLPWVSSTFGGGNGLDVPLSFLWSLQSADGIKLGVALLVLAGAAAALTFLPGTGPLRRILGVVAMAVAVVYAIQLFRFIDQLGGGVGDVFDTLGVAAYVTLAGGGLLAASK